MKKISIILIIAALGWQNVQAQQRITKKELELFNKNLQAHPLLQNGDADFKDMSNTSKWTNESAVILCKKTSFEFDKKGVSAGKRIGRNIWGLLFALPTLGTSLYYANATNDTKILIEETERCKILLNDKFALEQYSVLYFRLSNEGDAFSARVIKKDGSVQPVDISNAIKIEDIKTVPDLFRSYTDNKISAAYRPDYFKVPVSDLEEGDIIEYEFTNFNNNKYPYNPNYKEFDPVYYLCNRSLPVSKQVIEVITKDDKYHIGYKNLKGAPEFSQSEVKGNKVYRWVDQDRDKLVDTRFVNEFTELPSIKFQIVYARNNSKSFIWFKDENDMKRELSTEELADKAKLFWFEPEKLQATGDYSAGLKADIPSTVKSMFKAMKKKGITEGADDEYVKKAYYFIRSQTLYHNWSDFAFARVFSGLLSEKKIAHDIVVSAPNEKTNLSNIAFTQEIAWIIKYKNKFFYNPNEHLNPEELPVSLSGNVSIRFNSENSKGAPVKEVLPLRDTTENYLLTQIKASLDTGGSMNLNVDKYVEVNGLLKEDLIDDILALTPFMETDYKNYDGNGMWEGLSSQQEEKAVSEFSEQKKEWKEQKPKMMKAIAENDYGFPVEKYTAFHLTQDGRSFKKKALKYGESFSLSDMAASAGEDKVVSIGALMGRQIKIKKEEFSRTQPVDVRYPRTMTWNIELDIPAGYTPKGLDNLSKNLNNESVLFSSSAKIVNNKVRIDIIKQYKAKFYSVSQWPQIREMLDAAYSISQTKIIFQKQ